MAESIAASATVTMLFGDGGKAIWLKTFGNPGGHYIVRIDSSWSVSNWGDEPLLIDHLDEIYEAIEEEFGCGECAYCGGAYGDAGCVECSEEPESEAAFPRFVLGAGAHWGLA